MKFLLALIFSAQAFADGSDVRQLQGAEIKNGSAILSLPTATGTMISNNSTISLLNKTISGSLNTLSNLPASALSGQVSAASGGTGLATLTLNGVLFGNGASNVGVTLAGTQYQILQAGLSGVPEFDAVHLDQTAATTGALPLTKGGTGATTQSGAANSILPNQATNGGKSLQTDGTNVSWAVTAVTGSNLFLSNLSSPTAVNKDLIFDTVFTSTVQTKADTVATHDFDFLTGDSSGAGTGSIFLSSGLPASNFNSGNATLVSAPAIGTGNSGGLLLGTGSVVNGISADINISAGTVSGTGTRGALLLDADHIDVNNKLIRNAQDPLAPQDVATRAYVDGSVGTRTVVDGGDAAYPIATGDWHIRTTTTLTGGRTWTLPACTINFGEKHEIKNTPDQTFNISVAGDGGDLIDGNGTYTLAPGDSVSVVCAVSGTWDIE